MSGQGADTLPLIIDALVTIQRGMTPPSEAPKAPVFYDELTADVNAFPAWINVPRAVDVVFEGNNLRELAYTIDSILVFSKGDTKYGSRAQRLWIPVILDALSAKQKLGNNAVQVVTDKHLNLDPIDMGTIFFTAITVTMRAVTEESFTFGL